MINTSDMDMGITPLLYMVAHKCSLTYNKKLKELSISLQQAAVLAVIEFVGDGAINQKTLSKEMCVKESSVSSIVKTMIKNNFIYKEQSKEDARNQLLKTTEKGKEIMYRLKNSGQKLEKELYGHLSEDERNYLIAILRKMA